MVIGRILLAALLVAALFVINHYAPLQPAVVAVYAGFGLVAVGLVSILKPLRLLFVRSRARGLLVLLAGIVVTGIGLSWGAPVLAASGPRQRLDDFMPAYSFYERHETRVKATPAQVARAVKEVRLTDMPIAVLLLRIRAGRLTGPPPPSRPLLDLFSAPGSGFLPLDATSPGEWVGGMVGRFSAAMPRPRVSTPQEFLAFKTPGYVKVAFNMRWMDEGGGYTRITTETRCAGTSEEANRSFATYWRVIYPGSAIIRRVWLDAIVRLAEHYSGGQV